METIVVYGPRACGKTTHKLAIAAKYEVDERYVFDDPFSTKGLPAEDALVLTCAPIKGFRNIPFAEAMIGINQK